MAALLRNALVRYSDLVKLLTRDFGEYAQALRENKVDDMDRLYGKLSQRMERYKKASEALKESEKAVANTDHTRRMQEYENMAEEYANGI